MAAMSGIIQAICFIALHRLGCKLLLMGGVDQHEPGHFVGVDVGIEPGVETTERVADEHIGAREAGAMQQGVQLFDHNGVAARRAPRLAPAEAGAIVVDGPGEARSLGLQRRPDQPGRAQEELLHRFGLARQHLLGQVVDQMAMAAAKGFDEGRQVVEPLHGEGRELQPGYPAFGACFQGLHYLRRQGESHHLLQERGGFLRCEAQIGSAQLLQLSAGAHACERQRRVCATGLEQVQVGRQMLQQVAYAVVDRLAGYGMVIVEDENERLRPGGYVVQQESEDDRKRRRLRGMQERQRPIACLRPNPAQRGDGVDPEAYWIVVLLIQRQPGDAR